MYNPNEPEAHTHVRMAMKALNDALISCDDSPSDTVLTALALVTVNFLRGDGTTRNLDKYVDQLRLADKIS
jgi:hypothetical protein